MNKVLRLLIIFCLLIGLMISKTNAQEKDKKVEKKEKKIKPSKILVKRNVESVKIVKVSGEINKVEVKFKRFGATSNQNIKDLLLTANSGSLQRGDNYAEFQNVNNWPFEGRISFNAIRKTAQLNFDNTNPAMQQVQGYQPCEVEVQINEPGHWIIEINF